MIHGAPHQGHRVPRALRHDGPQQLRRSIDLNWERTVAMDSRARAVGDSNGRTPAVRTTADKRRLSVQFPPLPPRAESGRHILRGGQSTLDTTAYMYQPALSQARNRRQR
jgi:hypothetical protein